MTNEPDAPQQTPQGPNQPPQTPRGEPASAVKERLERVLNRDGGPAARRPAAPEPAAAPHGRMSGLGRMLNRVAGAPAEAERPRPETIAERVSDRMARVRQAEADFDDLASPDAGQDNVEIPAFLRRQAN